ncbi:hypothetical protein Bca101_022488 [Brassica carinata]
MTTPHHNQSFGKAIEIEEEESSPQRTEMKSRHHIIDIAWLQKAENEEPDKCCSTSSGEKVQQTEEDKSSSSLLTRMLSSLAFKAKQQTEEDKSSSSLLTRMLSSLGFKAKQQTEEDKSSSSLLTRMLSSLAFKAKKEKDAASTSTFPVLKSSSGIVLGKEGEKSYTRMMKSVCLLKQGTELKSKRNGKEKKACRSNESQAKSKLKDQASTSNQVDEDEPVKDNVVNAHLNVGSTAVFLNPFTPSVAENTILVMVLAELMAMRKAKRGKAKRRKAKRGLSKPELAATTKDWEPTRVGTSNKGISAMISLGLNTILFTAGISPGHSGDTWEVKTIYQISLWIGAFFSVASLWLVYLIHPMSSAMQDRTLKGVNILMLLALIALLVMFSEATMLMSVDKLAMWIGGVLLGLLLVVLLYFKVPLFRRLLSKIGLDLTGTAVPDPYKQRTKTLKNITYEPPPSEDSSSDSDGSRLVDRRQTRERGTV